MKYMFGTPKNLSFTKSTRERNLKVTTCFSCSGMNSDFNSLCSKGFMN